MTRLDQFIWRHQTACALYLTVVFLYAIVSACLWAAGFGGLGWILTFVHFAAAASLYQSAMRNVRGFAEAVIAAVIDEMGDRLFIAHDASRSTWKGATA